MNSDNFRPEDRSESDDIRRALNDAVSEVEPHEALDSIRERTTVTPFRSKRPWLLGAAAAMVATAATIAAVAAVGNNAGTTTSPEPPIAGSESPTVAVPSETSESDGASKQAKTPTEEPSETQSAPSEPPSKSADGGTDPQPTAKTVPVYYVGETSRGPRLYREFHAVETAQDAATAAAVEAMTGAPDDADYRESWPQGASASSVALRDGVIVVDLDSSGADLRARPNGMSAQEASIAVEQLVYTVQAALQDRAPVQLLIDGERTDMVLGVPASEPLSEGDSTEVLAQVWIIDPAENDELTAPFTVTGLANAFEANVQWELMKGDRVVKDGFTTARECCTMAPYKFKVNAPPGEYTLVVHDSDPSGGEGFAPWQDTKNVTVVP
jgi:hypothetical protein